MDWKNDKPIITEAYLSAINENNLKFFELLRVNIQDVKEILPLIEFIIERLRNVVNLTIQEELWDAEIILRSGLETFVKLLFIVYASPKERKNRIREFWIDLDEINQIKQSLQAKRNLKHLNKTEIHKLSFSPIILSKEKEKKLRQKWPKKKRKQLEQKWSFTEMINSLGNSIFNEGANFFEVLLHSYRISSHISHGDETGILIIKERLERNAKDQEVVTAAHYIRLLSDSYLFCFWSAISITDLLDLEKEKESFSKINEEIKNLEELTTKYQVGVFQDSDYDQYR